MGRRGPPPQPANVVNITGNRGKKSLSDLKNEIRPEVLIPEPPTHLVPGAKVEWERITPELQKLGLISNIDLAIVALYCQYWARWKQAEEKLQALGEDGLIDKTPNGFKQMSVWLLISKQSAEGMKSCLAEIGMTPAARSRVSPTHPQGDLFGYGNNGQAQKGAGPERHFTG
jgi:P27 family predicted phage terminase small subunit